jgi:hypothetical protein
MNAALGFVWKLQQRRLPRRRTSMLRQAGFQTVQVKRADRSEHTVFAHQLVWAVK